MAWTGQPLAYVTGSNGISVIDTGDNKVVDTILGPASSTAVAPDGKHVYALGPSTSDLVVNVSVIDATDDKIVATIPLDGSLVGAVAFQNPSAIAVTPDGSHVYATTEFCPFPAFACHPESAYFAVWVIDTATKKAMPATTGKGVAAGIAITPDGQRIYLTKYDPYYGLPQVLVFGTGISIPLPGDSAVGGIAITPDGGHAYVPYVFFDGSENVAIIDTATNTVMKTVLIDTLGGLLIGNGVAVTPDGNYVYLSNQGNNNVAVLDTTSNTIVKTVPVGTSPSGLAVTPDGAHVYVSNQGSNTVSVIDTASDTVVATVPVATPGAISIVPPPQGIPFLSFNAKLDIDLTRKPNHDSFHLATSFILSGTANNEIHPDTEPVKVEVGPFIATIPIGSFGRHGDRVYTFEGVIDGVRLEAKIEPAGGLRYRFRAEAKGANLGGITNPVQVSLGIGDDAGLTSVTAHFDRDHDAHNDWADR
ncbi:MAG TPA: YncE family protein [Chthoniobacterales bacterium]|nr:YncE family protein [Chthoniobacterales bacterium]